VTISLPNPPDGARPGQTVTVSVVTGSVENAVMINSAAVSSTGNRRTVTVVDGAGKQEVRPVQVGLEGDDATQITSGLASGERVVLPIADTSASAPAGVRGGGFAPAGGGVPPAVGGTGRR
jgi:macrolide-specific efflux system membrane fusion protein